MFCLAVLALYCCRLKPLTAMAYHAQGVTPEEVADDMEDVRVLWYIPRSSSCPGDILD